MKTSNLYVTLKCKYPKLLKWINIPLYLLGFGVFCPGWMFTMSEVHGEITGP
jgi:hypothetical protein